MSEKRTETMQKIIKTAAAEFLERESNRVSLLTVTDIKMSNDEKYATILFTVLPNTMEHDALEFAKRKRSEFREYIKKNTKLGRIPFFDFAIDEGEKHRQRIDEISLK